MRNILSNHGDRLHFSGPFSCIQIKVISLAFQNNVSKLAHSLMLTSEVLIININYLLRDATIVLTLNRKLKPVTGIK